MKAAIWLDEVYPIFRKWLIRHCGTPSAFMLEDFKKWTAPRIAAGEFDAPAHPNHWGHLMQRARADDLIEKLGYSQASEHKEAHGREAKVWRRAA